MSVGKGNSPGWQSAAREIGRIGGAVGDSVSRRDCAVAATRAGDSEIKIDRAGIALRNARRTDRQRSILRNEYAVERHCARNLVRGCEQRLAGRAVRRRDEGESFRPGIGQCRLRKADETGVDRIRHVIDHDATDAFEHDEGVKAAADLANGDAFGFGPLVIGPRVEGAGDRTRSRRLVGVEQGCSVARNDRFEFAAGFAHLGDCAISVLTEDAETASAERINLVDVAVAVGIAQVTQHIEPPQCVVCPQCGCIGIGRRIEDVARVVQAHRVGQHDARVAFVGSDEIGHAANRVAGDCVRLEQADRVEIGDVDATVLIAGVEGITGKAVVDAAERLDRNRRGARVGQVDNRDAIDFLQSNIGARAVWRDGNIFGFDIRAGALAGQDDEAAIGERELAAVESGKADSGQQRRRSRTTRRVDDRDLPGGVVDRADRFGLDRDEQA